MTSEDRRVGMNNVGAGMSLFDLVDRQLLDELRQHMCAVTGLTISFVDAGDPNREPLPGRSRFCELLSSTSRGHVHCWGGAWYTLPNPELDEISEHICEVGLYHLETPLFLEGELLGSIVVGQGLVERLSEQQIRELARRFGVPEEDLVSAYSELPVTTPEKLREVVTLTRMSALTLARYAQLGSKKQHLAELQHADESICTALFGQMQDCVAILDESNTIIDCNSAAERLTGYSRDELLGMTTRDFLKDREQAGSVRKRLDFGMPVRMVMEMLRKDGTSRMVETTVCPLQLGTHPHTLSINRDVTERVHIENEMRIQAALLDSVRDGVAAIDLEGTIVYWGPGAEALHGWTREEIVGKRKLSDITASPEQAREAIADLRSRGRRESEVELLRKDGSTFLAEVHSSAFRDDDGGLIGYIGTYRDITALRNEASERQRRLTELSRLRDELIEAERTEKRLIDNISHELRTPLTTVAAYIDMFESGNMGELTAAQEHAVEVMQHNVGRLDELVAEMLDSVRMDSGRMVIHHRPLDLCRVLERCVDHIAPQAKAAMMAIEFDEPDDPVFVDGDESQLARVFANLLANAVKFNVTGGRIDVSVHDHNHGLAVVTVRDTGIGISKDEHERIFERFYQVAKPHQRTYGGTGLGLTIARQIVELHEGHMSVQSEPGRGSEFRVALPTSLSQMGPEDLDPRDETVELSAGDNGDTRGSMLIIEDDEELLEMLLTGFSNHGFKVSGVCTGAEGIRAAQTELPDIVVLDLALPDTDGVEVCRSLRAVSMLADVPILGITAWSNREDLDRFAEAGAYKIVSKPFVFRDVLREVVQTVAQRTEG